MGLQQSMIPSITFRILTDATEAQQALEEAERKDFYLEECREDPSNARAREGCRYQARNISSEEEAFFRVVVDHARDFLPLRLRTELTEPILLVALDPSAEGGMPHTRPKNVICYPDIYTTYTVGTLLHELWHIHQRQYVGWWLEVFRSMDWEPVSMVSPSFVLPLPLESHRRFNPDTVDSPLWCFQRTWVPVPVFRDVARPKVGEVDIWFYHLSLRYHVKRLPRELSEQYPPSLPASAYEHPREIAAYLLSEPNAYGACPGFTRLLEAVGGVSLGGVSLGGVSLPYSPQE